MSLAYREKTYAVTGNQNVICYEHNVWLMFILLVIAYCSSSVGLCKCLNDKQKYEMTRPVFRPLVFYTSSRSSLLFKV